MSRRWVPLHHLHPKDPYHCCPQLSVLKTMFLIPEKLSPCSTTWAVSSLACPLNDCLKYPLYFSFQWISYKLSPFLILSYNMGCVPFWPLHENPIQCLSLFLSSNKDCVIFGMSFTWVTYCTQTAGSREEGGGGSSNKIAKEATDSLTFLINFAYRTALEAMWSNLHPFPYTYRDFANTIYVF